jgi:hypothetical protein
MLYSIEYDKDLLTETAESAEDKQTAYTFDKFMDDILIREGKSIDECDAKESDRRKRVIAEAHEHERRRHQWRERYADSPYSRMHVKK